MRDQEESAKIHLRHQTPERKALLSQLDLDGDGVIDVVEIRRAMRKKFRMKIKRGPLTRDIFSAVLDKLENANRPEAPTIITHHSTDASQLRGFDAEYFAENPHEDPNADHQHYSGSSHHAEPGWDDDEHP